MTRDFNNQRREDRRPDSRGSSSRRDGEERPSRPARPRLNRDMVDRAWENGARQNHADYRTRSEGANHPPRDNRRPNQHSNQYSAQNSNDGRKPYGGNRQDNYRPGEHSPRSNNGPRPRSFESSMRTFDDQKYNQYERRGYSHQPYQDEQRPGNRGNSQHPNSRSPYQGRDQYRGPQRREFERDSRSPRDFERGQSQARDDDRDRREPRSYDRDRRSSRYETGPDRHNPRWQSRPERQYNNSSRRPHEYTRYGKEEELYEGDYEHFDTNNSGQSHTRPVRAEKHTPKRSEERQVTRLPDGRILKGTPNEQNRHAEFWTEIAQESDDLVQPIESSVSREAATEHPTDFPNAEPMKDKPKPRTRTGSNSTRNAKTAKLKSRRQKSTPKPRSTGPKPSQRGYKWPKPDEEG
jgi:hypothetical protein